MINTLLNETTESLDGIRDEIYTAWVQATVAGKFNGHEDLLRKQQNTCHQLFGAYYTLARLVGFVDDNDWQEFLKGGK